jgi:ParB family chromosome partitioning protein
MPSVNGRRVLGRGLADLIPVGGGDAAATPTAGKTGIPRDSQEDASREAPIATVHPNPNQPRTRFDEAALAELAESVRANGILQPILVRPRKTGGGYEIVAGERRYRAALRAGLRSVPVVVRELSDQDALALALIENLIREDIGPLETARAFHRLMNDYGWTQEEMGSRVGKSRSAVANALRLLTLPLPIQESVERGELSEGHARTLIGDERQRSDPEFAERQQSIWREITARGLSVRETERRMRGDGEKSSGSTSAGSRSRASNRESVRTGGGQADFRAIEDRLRDALGTQIRLSGSTERGRIEIEYFSAAELDGLIERMAGA